MAGIGLRYPYFAKYSFDEATRAASYSGGGLMGKAVEFSAKIVASDDNVLYGDDGPAEVDTSFGGGTVSLTTDDLTDKVSAAILGVTPSELKVGEKTVQELIFDESREAPDLGIGVVIPKKRGGKLYFRAVVFPKVKFSVPEDAAKTKGEKIEWQTPSVEGTIMRDDTDGHKWKREATVESEALARDYIKQLLNITEADAALSALTLGSLSLTPAFSPGVTQYTAETANATNTIAATPQAGAAVAGLTVNGAAHTNGAAATWNEGENTVTVTVTNGAASKTYTIAVQKTTAKGE